MVRPNIDPPVEFSLRDFETTVDAGERDPVALKRSGERLYVTASKEAVLHVRLHAQAVINDVSETAEAKSAAQQIMLLTDPLAQASLDDPRWLELLRP